MSGFAPLEAPFTVSDGSQVRDNYPDLLARTHYPMLKNSGYIGMDRLGVDS